MTDSQIEKRIKQLNSHKVSSSMGRKLVSGKPSPTSSSFKNKNLNTRGFKYPGIYNKAKNPSISVVKVLDSKNCLKKMSH